jgi:hypothetical protein
MIEQYSKDCIFEDDMVYTELFLKRNECLIRGAMNGLRNPIKISKLVEILNLKRDLFDKVCF